jgi:ribonuclease G
MFTCTGEHTKMSERKFSNRRRPQRFKPTSGGGGSGRGKDGDRRSEGGGGNAKSRRQAQNARALATGEKSGEEKVFNASREKEVERAENVAAGLPPEGVPKKKKVQHKRPDPEPDPKDFEPAEFKEKSKGLVDKIKKTAGRVIKKVKKLISDEPKVHKEVIINYESLETRVAVQENGKLEEFNIERSDMERMAGSIYKGRIKNLEDGLKAAFVDIGHEKNAFLHYWDIIPSNLDSSVELIERDGQKKRRGRGRDRPKVTQKDIPKLYPKGTEIIIQVSKGPIGTKGPRVTTHLALPGRYLVLLPNSDQCGISRKIDSQEERQRLKKILRELDIPEGMGVIIRTVGEGQQKRYFIRDLALLITQWKEIQERIDNGPPASCVFQEPPLVERTVRDFLTEDVERIVIDDSKKFEDVKELIGRISKRSIEKVKLYHEPQPIFDRFGIQRQLQNAFSRQVHLKSGGYLVIDETEALVAIDINTGSHKGRDDEKDKTIFRVNEESADEICRLLRLRNLGGLIIIDFIDMRSQRDQRAIFNRMRNNLKRDRAKTHVLPISQLGLMEMTRQRHSESVQTKVYDDCGFCSGRGLVKNAMTMSVELQRKVSAILKNRARDESDFQLRIVVHPKVMDRLKNEDEKVLIELEKKFFGKLTFRSDPEFHPEQFKVINALSNKELASVGFD